MFGNVEQDQPLWGFFSSRGSGPYEIAVSTLLIITRRSFSDFNPSMLVCVLGSRGQIAITHHSQWGP